MKRTSESDSLSSDCSTVKRRKVSLATYQTWKTEMDYNYRTLSWLDCETSDVSARKTVEKLKCEVCIQYQLNIESRRNYSDKWVSGADISGYLRQCTTKQAENGGQTNWEMTDQISKC